MSRILIVDDNALTRKMVCRYLILHSGWEICGVAEDGLQAVQRAAELKPDVIVMDVSMPVLNGLEATHRIMSLQPSIPVLIFTVERLPQLLEAARRVGARDVICKSDGIGALTSAIEVALDQRH